MIQLEMMINGGLTNEEKKALGLSLGGDDASKLG